MERPAVPPWRRQEPSGRAAWAEVQRAAMLVLRRRNFLVRHPYGAQNTVIERALMHISQSTRKCKAQVSYIFAVLI